MDDITKDEIRMQKIDEHKYTLLSPPEACVYLSVSGERLARAGIAAQTNRGKKYPLYAKKYLDLWSRNNEL